jgi:methylenetetrahydrofolate reductase (NADPH)
MSSTNQSPAQAGRRIHASIEITPRQATSLPELAGLFPPGTRVYVADLGVDSDETLVAAARRVTDLGYVAVPHFAARRLGTKAALEDRIKASAQEAGVRDILVIGGGLAKPAGDFGSTMDVLEAGFLDRYGIVDVGVAGHPEGSPDFGEREAIEALRLKQAFGERTGARLRVVTQFGFNGKAFAKWAEGLRSIGVDLPVHLGVAGPAKVTTLLKYAAACGVGNSLGFLRKRAGSITMLATTHSPEDVVGPIEQHALGTPDSAIRQIHVFPFGGPAQAARWLVERGSWVMPTEAARNAG